MGTLIMAFIMSTNSEAVYFYFFNSIHWKILDETPNRWEETISI